MQLNVNTKALAHHANRLEEIHRSAMPVAIRNTLNSAAFDVKKTTMPSLAKQTFDERDKNFFKANSKVAMATGLNVPNMKATIGFIPLSGTNRAVDDLEKQEHGGNIGGRSFIALAQARTGNSWGRKPRKNALISQIRGKITDAKDGTGTTDAEKFIKSCIHAGKGGYVLGNRENAGGNRILYQVRSITRKQGNTVVKVVPLYAVKPGRKVKPKATHFMEKASLKSGLKMEKYFIEHAEKQLAKYKK